METLSLTLPRSWNELTDQQLYYIYRLHVDNLSLSHIKTLAFLKWANIRLVTKEDDRYIFMYRREKFYLTAEKLAVATNSLNWIGDVPALPVRISRIKGHDAVDAELQGVAFDIYLYCENLYQGYLVTQNHQLLVDMGRKLYNCEHLTLNQVEKLSIFYWWLSLKQYLSTTFPTFFVPMGSGAQEKDMRSALMDSMNAQIRALTGGDITKEKVILSMDVWRALTELEAQAKQQEEFSRKYGNK